MSHAALVLTAPLLNEEHIAAVRAVLPASNAGAPDILGMDRACEWHLDASPAELSAQLSATRTALKAHPVDINLIAIDAHRRKRLLIADMDSTIIEQECIDEIADFAGCGAEVAAITERAMRGELDFDEALRVRVGLLAGLHTTALERVISERLTVTPGAKTLVATMAANNALCALVSGGFTFFTSRIAETVGFHENRANTLEMADGKLTGRPVPPILGRQAKLDALNEFCQTRAIPLASTLAVGDGANDLAMIKAAGLGIAYHAKPIVAAEADAELNHSDLTALLYLQGYHQSEFIC
ncbi:MAG: phosphoserine phosphatase [Hyphomicrobiaceae bacterium]|jgi:phosphoserine phosphatase